MSSPADDVAAVLDESGPDYSEFVCERPAGGHRSDVYMVTIRRDGTEYEVVVKFEPPDVETFAVEPRLHDYVARRTDVPVPEILVFEAEPDLDVPPYFVTARLEGENLAEVFPDLSMDQCERILTQAGWILGEMHDEIAFEAFGWLDLHDDRIVVRDLTGNWREYFAQLTRKHIDGLAETPFDDVADRARGALERSLDLVPTDGVPRLVHDDFRPANLLVNPDAMPPITAVLDWQDVLAAHAEYHLAATEFLFVDSTFEDPEKRARLRDALHLTYCDRRGTAIDDGYPRRRAIYQLSTLLWRMNGFEGAFADEPELVRARAEAQYRQQFERLIDELPAE